MTATPFGGQDDITRQADGAVSGAPVQWTEQEVYQLEQPDVRLLLQVATLRSCPIIYS